MKKKLLSAVLSVAMVASLLMGCGSKDDEKGEVYFLNFKPEVDQVWQDIAKAYTEETGVAVKVVTAASGTYEETLKSEVAKTDAPTLFQINGPIGYNTWQDYCLDLSDTKLYSWLLDKSIAVTGKDGGVFGIPYVVEGYGIIYNNAIMSKFFAMEGALAKSMDDINNYA
ncbi:MAG: extracellular solute-binding protein, partial [Clostridiales bacterium]|nr:extracellular solute-binding protein [Clostridiales bacterium]